VPPAQNKYPAPSRVHRERFPRSNRQPGTRVSARWPHLLRLDSAITEYLSEVQARYSIRAADRLRWPLDDFRQSYPFHLIGTFSNKTFMAAHTRNAHQHSVMCYLSAGKKKGWALATLFGGLSYIVEFTCSFEERSSRLFSIFLGLGPQAKPVRTRSKKKPRCWPFFPSLPLRSLPRQHSREPAKGNSEG
jgi:hypothetical protein